MYIKTIKNTRTGKHQWDMSTQIREAKTFTHEIHRDNPRDVLVLTLIIDGETFSYDENENDSMSIFVMNESGKTIDRIEWDYLTIHPELQA